MLCKYDYLDLGCSQGASLRLGREKFLGAKGIGIDIDPQKVGAAQAAGYHAIVADAVTFEPGSHRFQFVTSDYLLEHLPNMEAVATLIVRLPKLAQHFAYLATPSFEAEAYLRGLGLRRYWMNWSGHSTHVTIWDFLRLFAELNLREFDIQCVGGVWRSWHPSIIPYDSPPDQLYYDRDKHEQKRFYYFSEKIFREIQVLLRIPGGDRKVWEQALELFHISASDHSLPLRLHELGSKLRGSDRSV